MKAHVRLLAVIISSKGGKVHFRAPVGALVSMYEVFFPEMRIITDIATFICIINPLKGTVIFFIFFSTNINLRTNSNLKGLHYASAATFYCHFKESIYIS